MFSLAVCRGYRGVLFAQRYLSWTWSSNIRLPGEARLALHTPSTGWKVLQSIITFVMSFITTTRLWYNSVVKLQETTKHSRQRPCFLKINNHWSWMSYLTASSQGSLLPIASLQVLTTPAFPLSTPAFPLSTPAFPLSTLAFPLSTPAFPLSVHMSKHISNIL